MNEDAYSAKKIRRMKVFVASVLCIYFFIGLATFSLFGAGHDKNLIPFFHWFLFAFVPNEAGETHYELYIRAVGDGSLETPVLFSQAKDLVTDPRSNRARDAIRRIGRALESGDLAEAERVRAEFEHVYLLPQTLYEVRAVTYQPLERFKTGRTDTSVVLATYKSPL